MMWNIVLIMLHLSLFYSRYLLVEIEGDDEGFVGTIGEDRRYGNNRGGKLGKFNVWFLFLIDLIQRTLNAQ